MKLLVVSQYFWPESFIINDLVQTLSRQGHDVSVLTGMPNYPDGKRFPGYEGSGCSSESFGSVKVYRVPLRPRGSGGARNLLLNYSSFVVNATRYGHRLLGQERHDAILVFAPSPITSAIPAIWLKWRRKLPLSIWVQDLWPESLSATGFIKNRLALHCVGLLVRLIYFFSDKLLVQSRAFETPVARYTSRDKIAYYPNSYAPASGNTAGKPIPGDLRNVLQSKFCIVFAGNIGTAQAVETIVAAAVRLRDLSDCRIVMVGSGSKSAWLEELAKADEIPNIILAGRLPSACMEELFSLAGGLLVTLKREEIFRFTIPSKIQAYLSSGRPLIAALDGEGARVIDEAGAGLTCPSEDAEALAEQIRKLYQMPATQRDAMGASGRRYFGVHFEMEKQASVLISLLQETAATGS